MKFKSSVLVSLIAVASFVGCAKKSPDAGPASLVPAVHLQTTRLSNWQLKLTSACSDEDCLAGYGFTVFSDGSFQAGPAPNGEVHKGKIQDSELESIKDQLVDLSQPESCGAPSVDELQNYKISLRVGSDQRSLIRRSATEFCHMGVSGEAAETLRRVLIQIADNYYPVPFPDACLAKIDEAESLMGSLQGCYSDKDCAYIGSDGVPIPPTDRGFVLSQSCSKIPPFMVGNARSVRENQAKLHEALSSAVQTCGARILRAGCDSPEVGFQSQIAPPVCDNGTCRVNPALGI